MLSSVSVAKPAILSTFLPIPNLLKMPTDHLLLSGTVYILGVNVIYLSRRAWLRQTTPMDIFRTRIAREPQVTWKMHCVFILAWQVFVAVFPFVELLARLFGHVTFMFSYPNANGFGYILEPVAVQHLPSTKRAKKQIRFDWHTFSLNIGGIGREGYRHPPSVIRNLPHIDAPRWSIKHWPWRQRYKTKATEMYKKRVNFEDARSRKK